MAKKSLDASECNGELFVKRGKRYVSTNDPWAYTGLQKGHWHVWVREGSTTIRQAVWPDRENVAAAMLEAEEAMVQALSEKAKVRPPSVKMSARHQKAWARYVKEAGEEAFTTFSQPSMWDIVQAGITALKERKYAN